MSYSSSIKQTYYGLGDNLWKQIIDGKDHQYGKDVYDQGLHRRSKAEQGYLKGVISGSEKAIELLSTNDLTIDIYKNIHKITCSHFNGAATGTSESDTPGNFRTSDRHVVAYLNIRSFGSTQEERELMSEFNYGAVIAREIFNPENQFVSAQNPGKVPAEIDRKCFRPTWEKSFGPNRDKAAEIIARTFNSVDALNKDAKPYGTTFYKIEEGEIMVSHSRDLDLEKSVSEHFEAFTSAIKSTTTAKEKLICIAKLFQGLEWLHPPADGTTRTDLLIMNVLLCKYGLNPVILYDPNFALVHTLDQWIPHLEQGIKAWQAERGIDKALK